MRVNTMRFQFNSSISSKKFTPLAVRYNSFHDMDFDIIASRIKSENLKYQMTRKINQIKNNINKFVNSTANNTNI